MVACAVMLAVASPLLLELCAEPLQVLAKALLATSSNQLTASQSAAYKTSTGRHNILQQLMQHYLLLLRWILRARCM